MNIEKAKRIQAIYDRVRWIIMLLFLLFVIIGLSTASCACVPAHMAI